MAERDDAANRTEVIRALVLQGRSNGYLVRSEVIHRIGEAGADAQACQDVLDMLSDMGFAIHEVAPTDGTVEATRVTALPEKRSDYPPLDASNTPTGTPIIVVQVGAEGGSIRLIAQPLTSGWRYRCTIIDQTDRWLDDESIDKSRQSPWAYNWSEALRLLDRYPWAELYPKAVNREFSSRVVEAALSRLDANRDRLRASKQQSRWIELLVP